MIKNKISFGIGSFCNCTDYYSINILYSYSQSEATKFLINVKVINYVYRFIDYFFPVFFVS